ncbi:astacin-like metalloprotease toxin 5 [Uloborus diversus]|uniref:astacin-like metalloprotease toxin 5 n=1 Tax=Uloborus diversus TaxID=327109 RepID=UPI002409AECE|nr:astacin-like metalloprotease toxin 5 [Uloborus diversus]
MDSVQALCVFISLLSLSWARSLRNPMENPDLYQGDILELDDATDRNAVVNKSRIWPGGVIPYKIDPGLNFLKSDIEKAMNHIMEKTCLKFRPWDEEEKGYIRIFPGFGCYSYWGRTGKVQPVSLGQGCEPLGTIIHELTHAIGFDHEQNRSDRDDYLIIYWQNIWPDALDQFDKHKPEANWLINEFDFDSIMLYGEKTFSKDGWSHTMRAKKKGIRFVDVIKKGKLSTSDIYRINKLYECDKRMMR